MGVARHPDQRQLRRTTGPLLRNASRRGLTFTIRKNPEVLPGKAPYARDLSPDRRDVCYGLVCTDSAFCSSSISLSAAWSAERHTLLSSGGAALTSMTNSTYRRLRKIVST